MTLANAIQQLSGAIGLFVIVAAAASAGREVGYLLAAGSLASGLVLAVLLRSPAAPLDSGPAPEQPEDQVVTR